MKTSPYLSRAAVLTCSIAASLLFVAGNAQAAPEYETAKPVSVSAGGQTVQMAAGQTVTVLGTPDASGNVMIRVVLPNGSLTVTQIPASSIRQKVAATPVPATPAPVAATPAATETAPAPDAGTAAPVAPIVAAGPVTATNASAPDFGPNVLIFDPSMTNIQALIDPIAATQKEDVGSQFNNNRYALLFKPGTYNDLDIKVGFYMHVIGLGQTPDAVTFAGKSKGPHSAWYGNVTQTFWRAMENFKYDGKELYWGVSQGTTLRRVHSAGSLSLFSGGWASGGFMADCKIDNQVVAGSQQQWLTRNSEFARWSNAVWNMVFVGVPNAPSDWSKAYTAVPQTPIVAEKPYLYFENGKYFVRVPAIKTNSSGVSWTSPTPAAGKSLSISEFYLAHAGKDTAATINAALASGKHLLLTPGIYKLEASINVTRPDTVVLGIGYATLIPTKGTPAIKVADVDGVRIGCILFEASTTNTPALLQIGEPGSKASHATNPIVISDIFCRVGGPGPGSADTMVTINSNNVIGDNAWLWRADHGSGWGWNEAKNKNGVVVNGNDVTYYGLAVEHTQEYQTLWNGNGGRVYFYQSEIPYDVPSQAIWRNGANGYASYKVGDNVTTHEAWGLGVYSLFNAGVCILDSAYEVPARAAGVRLHHMNAINLGGKAGGQSGIAHVVNQTGDSAIAGNKFKQVKLEEWPAK